MSRVRSTTPWIAALLVLGLGLAACAKRESPEDAAWRAHLEAWRQHRLTTIAGEDGWITLVTRTWLVPGANRLGSDKANEVVLPADRAPALAGTIFLEGEQLRVEVQPGVTALADGQPVTARELKDDAHGKPTMLTLGSLTLHVIKRDGRWALRAKDRNHPARATFPGLLWYAPDPKLRVRAHLEPAPAGKTLPILTILGTIEPMTSPGTLRFVLDGTAYALDAVREPGDQELFILFRDATGGKGTYPSGRFLDAPLPDANGDLELDFNRAYNPPCAFTSFAACPIPPKQNHLPIAIEAGERYRGEH